MAEFTAQAPKRIVKNRRRRVLRIWLLIAFLALFAMLAPFLFEGRAEFLEFDELGGAMMVLGLLLSITGFITAGFYRGLARTEDRLHAAAADPSRNSHRFTYAPEEWRAFVHEAYRKDASRSKGTWVLVAVISLVVGVGFAFVTGDIAFSAIFIVALLAFLSLFAFGAPLARRSKLLRSEPEVVLSREGLLVGSALHPFASGWTTLENVDFKDGWLTIVYAAPTRTGMQDYTADVWFPERLRPAVQQALHATFGNPPPPSAV